MGYSMKRSLTLLFALAMGGCGGTEREWVLPDPEQAAEWYGDGAAARLDGNVLEVQGSLQEDHLRRGGRLWARSGAYFYLFNVHVQRLFQEYPDLAAVRARVSSPEGETLAVVMLERSALNEYRWEEALARMSHASQDGTRNPRAVERFVQFGEDHTTYEYRGMAR
jgi:hypothetical protein